MNSKTENSKYSHLVGQISDIYLFGFQKAVTAVNTNMVQTYWKIGQYIVDFEQNGNSKAAYGKALLENLSKDLLNLHGKGFSRSNLSYMRLFYQRFPICEELPHKLNWTHFCELLKIDDPLERLFYQKQKIIENWSIN